jgi:tRNA G10  N-methylase Trm11
MNRLVLQENVQFIYEEQLAGIELKAFGCSFDRDEDDGRQLRAELNGHAAEIITRSAYVGTIDGERTIYDELVRPAYRGGRFNRTRSVNQYLTHWIYPYRGKYHPQMVRALFNTLGAKPGQLALDPFGGSGTTALEASLLGLRCISVDPSPVCELVTRVKTQAWRSAGAIVARVVELLAIPDLDPTRVDPVAEEDHRVADFLQVARLVTASDVGRRRRESAPAFRKNLAAMVESVQAHALAVREFLLEPGEVKAVRGDVRYLDRAGLEPDSVDAVVTSPPYSIALDYVQNDEHALEILKENRAALRELIIGVRGQNPRQRMAAYNQDMQLAFAQIARVMRPGARAAFVIGNATFGGEEVTTTEDMIQWAAEVGLSKERVIPKIVFGLYNVMQDEKILIFRKE